MIAEASISNYINRKRHKSDRKTIIAVDGEGITKNGRHHYTLLAASNGEYIERLDEIRTHEALDFLLQLKRDTHSAYLICGFSLNYDVNMWLVDVPQESVQYLLEHGHVYWKFYSLRYKPGKVFSVKNRPNGKTVTVYDVFGFFQSSFVRALTDWRVGDSATIDRIARMKEQRGDFATADKASVRAYCFLECALLVQLVERLIAAVNRAEIPCSQWYGVGALASGMLKKFDAKSHLAAAPESMSEPILAAYFGGRFEIAGTGHFGHVVAYDIKSAYPSVARSLPCLTHTTFVQTTKYEINANALWRVRWNVARNNRWGPFPWRTSYKTIHYPLNGEGWYWSSEVRAARRLYGDAVIEILGGYVLKTACKDKPFAFIDDVYAVRQEYERNGDFAHKALKLALNALYGKTAQSIGSKKVPPYQSYIWAGMITAGCRAQILAAIRASDDIVSIATDGIISTTPIDVLTIGKQLGQWERTDYVQCFLVQPGIYRLTKPDGGYVEHTRGFGSKETDFDAIERDFKRNPLGKHRYQATRFIGAAGALATKNFGAHWRQWVEQKRVINFAPYSRFIIDIAAAHAGIEPIWSEAPRLDTIEASTPYEPKQSWIESWKDDVDLLIDLDQP